MFLDYVNLNPGIKKSLKIKEEGFVFEIPGHEIIFNILIIIGIILILFL